MFSSSSLDHIVFVGHCCAMRTESFWLWTLKSVRNKTLALWTGRLRTMTMSRWSARGGHMEGSTLQMVMGLMRVSLHQMLSRCVQLEVVVSNVWMPRGSEICMLYSVMRSIRGSIISGELKRCLFVSVPRGGGDG